MNNSALTGKIRIVFAGMVLFTAFVLGAMYANMHRASRESANVRQSLDVLMHMEHIAGEVETAENGRRVFMISGDNAFMQDYRASIDSLDKDVFEFSRLTLHNAAKGEDAATLASQISEKIREDKMAVEDRLDNGFDSSGKIASAGNDKALLDNIIMRLNNAEEKERAYMQATNQDRAHYANWLTGLFFVLASLFCISIVLGYIFIMRDFRQSEKINRSLVYNSTLLRNISDAIITTDNNSLVTDWNVHAEMLYGYGAAEAKGKNIMQLLRVEFNDSTRDEARRAIEKTENWKGEVVQYAKNGRRIDAGVSSSLLKNEAGEVIGIIMIVRDISERVLLEKNLTKLTTSLQQRVDLKSNELNLFFDRIADSFIALDNDWNYAYLNKAALDTHGKRADELVGKNIWELFPEVQNEPFYHALHEARNTQQPQRTELYFSTQDIWYEDLIYPGPDGISVYYRDITEKKKADEQLRISEEALKFSNERFELVAKATNDAIWDWDMKQDRLTGNESFCRLFGIGAGEFVNYEKFMEKVHPEDRERIKEKFLITLRARESMFTEDFRYLGPDGKYRAVYDRANILYDRDRRAYRMLGALQDITAIRETQEKLQREKELSDSIINSLPGIFYLFNKAGEFYVWNRNFSTVSGYSDEEILTMHPLDFFIDAEKPALTAKIQNVFATGSDNTEALFKTKSGETVPYYFTGMLINYEDEECLMGVGIDVSEKIRSQQELVNNEEKFRMLIQQASDGIIITDEDGHIINVNETVEKFSGYSEEELQGMNVSTLFYNDHALTGSLRYSEMARGITVLAERQIRRKNGRLLSVEMSSKQMPDGLFQGIIRDITERKLVEEALRNSEKKYRVLFNENPLPMWIISLRDKKFVDVNSAALLSYGYSKEEFLALQPPSHDAITDHAENFDADLRRSAMRDHRKKDGSVIKVNIIPHDIIYEGVPAVLVLADDITAKFEAEENLQRSHEAMRELASHLETIRETERTHMAREIHDELGQQLTGLKMDISWLAKKIKSEDAAVNEKIKDAIGLIDKTVITVRRIATELRPSILDDLGLVAAMEWQSEEFEKRAEIRSRFSSNKSFISVSPDIATGIFRIFQESLTNVLRHSQATEVVSSIWYENEILTLMIEDNGVGFREEDILHKKTLGLLGMKERVSLINGSYEINGNAGHGTCVRITVPLA